MSKDSKLGIFGGTFNPIHNGHINSMVSVAEKIGLESVEVIPTYQSPHRGPVQGPTAEQRAEMVQLGIAEYDPILNLNLAEVERGGVSYTVDTLNEFLDCGKELFLIIGADQIGSFDKWKDFKSILEVANLAVTSRPGGLLPKAIEDLPDGIQNLVESFSKSEVLLKTGKKILFIYLEDIEISSTEIRKAARLGLQIDDVIPEDIARYIEKNEIYEPIEKHIDDFEAVTRFCGEYLFSRKGIDVQGWNLEGLNKPSEFTLVVSGTSRKHSASLADNLVREVKKKFRVYPQSIDGKLEGNWIVLDYGSLMVHVFYDFIRQEVKIEELWRDGVNLELEDPTIKENEN